jgi:hypothetical protein
MTWRKREKRTKCKFEGGMGRSELQNLSMPGKIILKWMLTK